MTFEQFKEEYKPIKNFEVNIQKYDNYFFPIDSNFIRATIKDNPESLWYVIGNEITNVYHQDFTGYIVTQVIPKEQIWVEYKQLDDCIRNIINYLYKDERINYEETYKVELKYQKDIDYVEVLKRMENHIFTDICIVLNNLN